MEKMTGNCESVSCLISRNDPKKITGIRLVRIAVRGLGRKQTLAHPSRGFGALKYDVRHAALVELGKKETGHV
jgi:hypothetical protein